MSEEKSTKVLNVQEIARDKVMLEIEISTEKVKKAIDHAYREVINKVNIPGFRKGKAPRKLVESKFGKEYFYHEAQNELVTPAFITALNETNIKPIASELKDIFIEEGKPMTFKIEVQKEPVFDIKETAGIALTGGPVEVTEKEIEGRMDELKQRHAKLEIVTDRPAQSGDFVIIDYQGYLNGELSNAIKGAGAMFEIGAKRAIEGFEDGIIGMSLNEEKDLDLKFPENYHGEDLSGKDVRFHITLKEIKIKVVPESNDDFAKLLGEFNTLSELRDDIRQKLLDSKDEHQKAHYKEQICAHLLEKNPEVEAPEAMVEKELDGIIKNYELEFIYRRMDFKQYLQSVGQTVEDFKKRHHGDAIRNVKISNILSSIGQHEKINATEEEVKEKIQKLALSVGKTYSDVRKHVEEEGNLVYIKDEIVHQKVHELLINKAKITIDPNYKCGHENDHEHVHGESCDHGHDHEA